MNSRQTQSLRVLILILAGSIFTSVFAGIKEDFFLSGRGAKSFALGGTAFAFGVNSLYTNPAGLAVLPGKQFSYSYQSRFDNLVQQYSFSYMNPWNGGAWALGVLQNSNGDADKTVDDGFNRPLKIGSFGETQTGLSLAFGIPFWADSALGLGIQQYFNQLDTETASSTALSIGLIKKWGSSLLTGISIHNLTLSDQLHAPIHWSTGHQDYFPLRISSSVAWMAKLFDFQTEWYADMQTTEVAEGLKMVNFYSVGSLVWLMPKTLTVMTGYAEEQISAGIGLYLSEFALDYAFLSHTSLGVNHLLSLGLQF